MTTKYHKPLLVLGIYELFFSTKLLWNLFYGHMNSIMIANQILSGISAKLIFLAIGLAGLCLGYGIIKLQKWSYGGFIVLHCFLLLIYISNLFLMGVQDPTGFWGTVPDNYLTDSRLVQLRKAVVVSGLLLFIWYHRRQFRNQERLTTAST